MDGINLPYKTKIHLSEKKIHSFIKNSFPDEKITSVTAIEGSFVNPVYSFELQSEKEYILKVNNPHWPSKQEREVFTMNLVRDRTSIPVPQIIENKITSNKDELSYIIMEKAPGKYLLKTMLNNSITNENVLAIIEKSGNYLGQMHSLQFDFFGNILQTKPSTANSQYFWGKRFQSWPDCFRAFCFNVLNWVDTKSYPDYRSSLKEKIDYYASVMPNDEPACFVHSDVHPTNVVIHNNSISALIDFEWSYAGSASFDYQITKGGFYFSVFPSLNPSIMYNNYPEITKEKFDAVFLKGYKTTNKKSLISMPNEISSFIWLLFMIGSWDWIVQSSSKEEIQKFSEDIHLLYSKFIK